MALTATAMRRDGRPDQAGAPVPFPAPGADADLTELEHQISVKTIAAKMLNERIRKLVAEAAAKDKRLAELEDSLRRSREDLAHRDNESRSLRTSLDLVTAENAHLCVRLNERTVDAEALGARFENSKSAVLAAEGERDRLAVALREANDLHRIETDELNDRLEAMKSRTIAVESLLVDVRRSLLAHIEESDTAARQAADAMLARNAAAEALGELHGSLQVKEHQVRELEQSRALLLAGAGTLLEAFEARVAALAEAEDKAKSLAGRAAEAEAKSVLAQSQIENLNLKLRSAEATLADAGEAIEALVSRIGEAEANSSVAQSEIETLNVKLQNEQASRAIAEVALSRAQIAYSRLRRELDTIVASDEIEPKQAPAIQKSATPAPVRPAESLLAATISF